MRFDTFLISFVLGTIIISSGALIIGEQNRQYDIESTDQIFENVTELLDNATKLFNRDKENLQETAISQDTVENVLFAKGNNFLTTLWDYIKLPGLIITALGKAWHFPAFVIPSMMVIIGLSLLITVIYLILRFQPR